MYDWNLNLLFTTKNAKCIAKELKENFVCFVTDFICFMDNQISSSNLYIFKFSNSQIESWFIARLLHYLLVIVVGHQFG